MLLLVVASISMMVLLIRVSMSDTVVWHFMCAGNGGLLIALLLVSEREKCFKTRVYNLKAVKLFLSLSLALISTLNKFKP